MRHHRAGLPSRRFRPSLEQLESRLVPSGLQPTDLEQLLLERLNDIRADPAAYGQSIGLDLSDVAPSQPLAFDTRMIETARGHSQDMNDNAFFGHYSSDGGSVGDRLTQVGYPWTTYAESIAAGFATPEAALEGLIVDAGVPDLGHRRHLLAIDQIFKEMSQVGVGIVENGSGPYQNYFTIDTARTADARPFLTGAVYNDLNFNNRYDLGEGVGNLTLTIHGVGTTTTFTSGGFSYQLAPGTYTVTFSGGALTQAITKVVTIGSENYRLSIRTNQELPASPEQLDRDLGLYTNGNLYLNWGGRQEKWLQGKGGTWYFITPDGSFYLWDGSPSATGTLIARLATSYYDDVQSLVEAGFDPLRDLFTTGNTYYNWGGLQEKWLQDETGQWYFLLANGDLYRWDGTSDQATGTKVAQLEPIVYALAEKLQGGARGSLATLLDSNFQFDFTGNDYLNYGGKNERWIRGAGNAWFFITPTGELYLWNGVSGQAEGTLIANLGADYYSNLGLLYAAA